MDVRKAGQEDLPEIMEIFAGARRFMVEHGNPDQWASRNWPPEELIRENISDGSLYVLAGDEQDPADIAAVFCMEYGEHAEPCYDEIEGSWLDDSPYAVIHHIASSAQGRGAGRRCLDWAYEKYGHVRLDTHEDNKVMQALVTKNGFSYRGIVYIGDGKLKRLAYEKC
ncbi:MAG: GNAT family N-acetyltransferase [Eubacterium sp.]|nr:GNAT family N-acetyltransferase [Eubacterium sp.]